MSIASVLLALSIFFFVTGFLGIWAIREGGSFAFMAPSRWKRRSGLPVAEPDRQPGPPEVG